MQTYEFPYCLADRDFARFMLSISDLSTFNYDFDWEIIADLFTA